MTAFANRLGSVARVVVSPRSHRGWWAYLPFALGYLLFCLVMVADLNVGSTPLRALSRSWPLLIPMVVLLVQWVRPTLLGWAVIFWPAHTYISIAAATAAFDGFGRDPQWRHDPTAFFLGFMLLVWMSAWTFGLMWAAWPRPRLAKSPLPADGGLADQAAVLA